MKYKKINNNFVNQKIIYNFAIQKLCTMFAIVELGGKQFKVTEGTKLYISRLDAEPDSTVESDKVLLIANDDDVKVGNPNVDGAKITFKVLEHLKGPKVTVFKKKNRKGYRVKRGFRPYLTKVEILNIQA